MLFDAEADEATANSVEPKLSVVSWPTSARAWGW